MDAATFELIRPALENLTKQHIRSDIEFEKQVQYAKARRNLLYYGGKQYIYPVLREGQTVDWTSTPGTAISRDNTKPDANRAYDYVINELRGLVDKAVAILAQEVPNVKVEADRKEDEFANRRARKAELIMGAQRANWDLELLVQDLAYGLSLDGTTFIYTPFVASEAKYGATEEPVRELRETPIEDPYFECVNCGTRSPVPEVQQTGMCPECGNPLRSEDYREPETAQVSEMVGVQKYANGCVEWHICDITTVTTLFGIKDLDGAPWLWYEYEDYKGKILSAYRDKPQAFKILKEMFNSSARGGTGPTTNVGQSTRDLASSPSGVQIPPRGNRWTYSRFWLTPDVYAMISDEQDQNGQIREVLAKECPEGAKLVQVNDKLIDIEPEKLSEVWVAVKPRPSKYLYADALFDDFVVIQDLINDLHNTMKEMADRNIPITVFDPTLFDPNVLKQHRATPAEWLPAKPKAGSKFGDYMWNSPTTTIEPQIINWVTAVRGIGQDIVGVTPASWGGESGVEKTARQAEMDRNQSLLQLGLPWKRMASGIARAHENAIIQQAKHGNGRIVQRRRNFIEPTVVEVSDMREVLQGGWHVKPAKAMPATWGQRRDTWRELLQQAAGDPAGLIDRVIGVTDPENAEIAQEALGMADWSVPMLNALYKVRDAIRRLSQEVPIEQVGPDGLPQLLPSIPPDEFEDNHEFVVQVVRSWAQREAARILREEKPDGYNNIIAWAKAHLMLAQPPLPMPPPEGGPGGPGGPPPFGPAEMAPPAPEGALEAGAPPPGPPPVVPGPAMQAAA